MPNETLTALKPTISAPFDFRHVTHTAHNELPKLDTRNDRGLMLEFWASCAQQFPADDVRGIKTVPIGDARARLSKEQLEKEQSVSSSPASVSPIPASPTPASSIQAPKSPSGSFQFSQGPLRGLTQNGSNTNLAINTPPKSPMLDTSAAMSRPSSASGQRPSQSSRSPSLASLLAEQRSAPTLVHPAFRDAPTSSPDIAPRKFGTAPGTPVFEQGNALGVVTEELEDTSVQSQPSTPRRQMEEAPAALLASTPSDEDLSLATFSDTTEPPFLDSSFGSSVASYDFSSPICNASNHHSVDSWEDDIDFCYYEGAEATCDYDWDSKTNSLTTQLEPKDIVFVSPFTGLLIHDQEGSRPSPRNSMARHHRAKSSMTLANLLPVTISDGHAQELPAESFDAAQVPLPLSPECTSDFEILAEQVPLPPSPELPSSLATPDAPKRDHTRTTSESFVLFSPAIDGPIKRRWSFIPPSYIPETAKSHMTRLSVPVRRRRRAQTNTPSPHPPPKTPLPPVPSQKRTPTHSSVSAASIKSTQSVESLQKSPQTPQERFMLHATGKAIRRSRPATPDTWSHPHTAETALRDAMGRSKSTPNVTLAQLRHAERSLPNSPALPDLPGVFPSWI